MPDSEPPPRRVLFTASLGAVLVALLVGVGLAWPEEAWSRAGAPLATSGWAPWWQTDSSFESFRDNAELFGDVSIVAYAAIGTDEIVQYERLAADAVDRFRTASRSAGVPYLATIMDESDAGEMATTLADPATRAVHVDAIVRLVDDGDFDGVDLDYEQFAFADGRDSWAATRPNWIAFLTELASRLHADGHLLVVSVPPVYDGEQTDDSGYWVYDYAAMGEVVDRIRIMAYDYSTSDPGPIAPIEWVEGLVEAIAELVPPEKLDLGVPAYGQNWVSDVTGTCPADQEPERNNVSVRSAARLAAEHRVVPMWDDGTGEQRFDYTETLTGPDDSGAATSCTVSRTVRYLDARSIHLRASVANRAGLHGIAIWALGNDDDATWDGIRAVRAGNDDWPASA